MRRTLEISSNDRRAMVALVRYIKADLPMPAEAYGRGSIGSIQRKGADAVDRVLAAWEQAAKEGR